jgi:hypothetical protein
MSPQTTTNDLSRVSLASKRVYGHHWEFLRTRYECMCVKHGQWRKLEHLTLKVASRALGS